MTGLLHWHWAVLLAWLLALGIRGLRTWTERKQR